MRRQGVALIGLGMAAAAHARSLLDLADRSEVIWACSRSEERCRRFAGSFSFPTTTDVERAMTDDRVEAVLLLTPASTHLALASKALNAGKHVLVEKPLALKAAEADTLVELACRQDLRLGVVLQTRFRDSSRRLAALIEDGSLGALMAGDCRVARWRPQSYYDEPGRGTYARDGGGVLLTQAIHALDLLRFLVGSIEVVASIATTTGLHRMECEDYAAALLRLGRDVPGSFVASTASFPELPDRIELVYSQATARLEGSALEIQYYDGRREALAAPQAGGRAADHGAHRALIADFLDAIEEGRNPLVDGAEAAATQHLIEAILKRASSEPE
jgi:predicted dehydrogenase